MPNLCQLFAASPNPSVKGRLGLDQFDVADDAILNQLIGWVGGRFEQHCGREFARTVGATEEFDGDACELLLQRTPIEAVTAFHLKDNETDGWIAQTSVDHVLRAARNNVKCVVSFPGGAIGTRSQRLRLTYTGGYVLPGTAVGGGQTALPSDIEGAAIEQTAYWYQRRHQLGLSNVSAQGGSVATLPQSVVAPQDLLPQVVNTLRAYCRIASL